MLSKYVDDTTAFEIIPRSSISILDLVVDKIHDYCLEHKMKLNPKKMQRNVHKFYEEFGAALRPISVGYKEVERAGSYELLGRLKSDKQL